MKKKLVLTAAVIAALSVVSCNSKKTNSQGADQDSLSYAGNDSLNSNDIVLDSIAGTYEGTLPAADCPGIKYNPQNEMLPFHKTKCSETQNEASSL